MRSASACRRSRSRREESSRRSARRQGHDEERRTFAMKRFRYTAAATTADACKLLGESSLALSGGTNLLALMKDRVLEPDVVVDLKRIPLLDRIEATADGASLGAHVTLAAIIEHDALGER